MVTATPPRTMDQRREALAIANLIRLQRAHLKHDLKDGTVTVGEVLADPPEWLATMKVSELLRAQPWWGLAKVKRALFQCEMSESKTVAGMSERQRRCLSGLLAMRGER